MTPLFYGLKFYPSILQASSTKFTAASARKLDTSTTLTAFRSFTVKRVFHRKAVFRFCDTDTGKSVVFVQMDSLMNVAQVKTADSQETVKGARQRMTLRNLNGCITGFHQIIEGSPHAISGLTPPHKKFCKTTLPNLVVIPFKGTMGITFVWAVAKAHNMSVGGQDPLS